MQLIKKLFLVDDDEDDREFFLTVVRSIDSSLSCEVAGNGKEAIEKLEHTNYSPDLIFLDLNMPVMGGRQFLLTIKNHSDLKDIPVVVLSTSSDTATIKESQNLGAAHFMTKPNKLSALEENLRRLFNELVKGKKH